MKNSGTQSIIAEIQILAVKGEGMGRSVIVEEWEADTLTKLKSGPSGLGRLRAYVITMLITLTSKPALGKGSK